MNGSMEVRLVIARCVVHRKRAPFSAKTARVSVKFCRIFERTARAWLAAAARRPLRCSAWHGEQQRRIFVRVPRVWRSFRADLCGFFGESCAIFGFFALISMQNRRVRREVFILSRVKQLFDPDPHPLESKSQ